MKRKGILNRDINSVLGNLGHTDQIVITDAGLPIPKGVACIDLSIALGIPKFIQIVALICNEMIIEQAFVSKDIHEQNPQVEDDLKHLLGTTEISYISHENFKEQTKQAKVIIRTGENSAFANVILQAGCIF